MAFFGLIKNKKPFTITSSKAEIILSDQTKKASDLFQSLIDNGTFKTLEDVLSYASIPENFITTADIKRIQKDLKSGKRASDQTVRFSASVLKDLGIGKNNALHQVGKADLTNSDLVAAPVASFLLANFDKICEMYAADPRPKSNENSPKNKSLLEIVKFIRKNIQNAGSRSLAEMESNYARIQKLEVITNDYASYTSVLQQACGSSPVAAVQKLNKILKSNQAQDENFKKSFESIIAKSKRWNELLDEVTALYDATIAKTSEIDDLKSKNEKLEKAEETLTTQIDAQIVHVDLLMDTDTPWITNADVGTLDKYYTALNKKAQQKATEQIKAKARQKSLAEVTTDENGRRVVRLKNSVYGKKTAEGEFTADSLYRLLADEVTASGDSLASLIQAVQTNRNKAGYILIQGNRKIKAKKNDGFEEIHNQEMLLTADQLRILDNEFNRLLETLPKQARKVNGVSQYNDKNLVKFIDEMQNHNPDIPFDFAHCSFEVKLEIYQHILNQHTSQHSLFHKKAQKASDQFFTDDLTTRKLVEHADEVEAEIELEALRNAKRTVEQEKQQNEITIANEQAIIDANNAQAKSDTEEMKQIQKVVADAKMECQTQVKQNAPEFLPYRDNVIRVIRSIGSEMSDSIVPDIIPAGNSKNMETKYYSSSISKCKEIPMGRIEESYDEYLEAPGKVLEAQEASLIDAVGSPRAECAAKLAKIMKFYGEFDNNLVFDFVDGVNDMASAVNAIQQALDDRAKENAPYAKIVKDAEAE